MSVKRARRFDVGQELTDIKAGGASRFYRAAMLLPLSLALHAVPDAMTAMLAGAFNRLMVGQALTARLRELDGRRVCLYVRDLDMQLFFVVVDDRLQRDSARRYDVRIGGALADFANVTLRAEDPDTLFFHRRLSIEGDTDTGLHLKNLLDAFEFDLRAHLTAVCGDAAGGALARVAMHLGIERRVGDGLRTLVQIVRRRLSRPPGMRV